MTNTKGNYRETCLVIMTGLLVFWMIYQVKVLVTIAIAIGIIGAFIPSLARGINWVWYKIAEVMGWVMSKVLLSIIFFFIRHFFFRRLHRLFFQCSLRRCLLRLLFLFPIALLYRLFNSDKLQLKRRSDSYWTEREHRYTEKDLENVW